MPATATVAKLTAESSRFGELLRAWRDTRKLSQLELSLRAEMSQRHLSFLESGRAQPSREMVLQVAEALEVPLRERNILLRAAGFAPLYRERALDSADMAAVRQALELTLKHHEPFPAVVVNRSWGLVMGNEAVGRVLGLLLGDVEQAWARVDPSGELNIIRMTLHPHGLQPLLKNWEQVAPALLARLQREAAADQANPGLQALLRDVSAYPGIPPHWRGAGWTAPPMPILPLEFAVHGQSLKLFSMISTFGTALDITAEELRVETFFPADDATASFFQQLSPTSRT
jgi:transcriptional regulator with XRE-family HTH domain